MSWTNGAIRWPSCTVGIHARASEVFGKLPRNTSEAVTRLQKLTLRAQYNHPPLSTMAATLAGLRGELDQLLVCGRTLTVTPYQHGIGQRQGSQHSLAAPNAVSTLASKLQDGADQLLPAGQLHAIAWLVTGDRTEALASALAPLCAVLPLPEWCATLRHLTAENEVMVQPLAVKEPRWKTDEPLVWAPLRPAHTLLGAEICQLESLAQSCVTPIEKLSALAARRAARLTELEKAIEQLATLSGQLWHWQGQGDAAHLATQLCQSSPPDHSHSMTVATLLLSPSPLTFWQELTQ